ncbi:MAG: bifunctional DNA-formamidopyrimidine glycosylase/DNA-(apurinic or apyrimidinic site) lyase [Patescibacteria group bacterium]|nr:bifunctional DNA-formamidopyrimidine glycosylase/DNA-(apurinic or apyrimidinic site) lyase [Patescibacteria group bacterium]MCL5257974.1 bifunctional DNA-formamidopyrimidine glycosylase/DNA-(apurinic or apyrimidinic site) lyase [Patescibacteria group bacterium]
MPELPEVETIKKGLKKVLIGKKIKAIKILSKKQIQGRANSLIGKKIKGIERRAKILIFSFNQKKADDKIFLVVHLKLSGQLVYERKNQKATLLNLKGLNKYKQSGLVVGGHPGRNYLDQLPNRYTRIILSFAAGANLYFNDLRKFGWFKIVNETEMEKIKKSYGPEAINISVEELKKIIATAKGPRIKQLLLDQAQIAGLGNIYTDESLFCAKINPFRLTRSIKPIETARLTKCVKKVLKLSLKHGGTSEQFYRDIEGQIGTFGRVAKVYRRTGQTCERCHHRIETKKIGGRSTHFCPNCQK